MRKPKADEIESDEVERLQEDMEWYLREMRRYSLLTREEEKELFQLLDQKRAELSGKKDQNTPEINAIRQKIANANLRLVVSIVKQQKKKYIIKAPFIDLVSEGNCALMRAVDAFDVSSGNKFSTYATWAIKRAISNFVLDQGQTLRLTPNTMEIMNAVKEANAELRLALGRNPDAAEIAGYLKTSVKCVETGQKALAARRETVSLSGAFNEDGERESKDRFLEVHDKNHEPNERDELFRRFLDHLEEILNEKQLEVIWDRFIDNQEGQHTLEDLGIARGVSKERIRQIQKGGLARVRRCFEEGVIGEEFLDLAFPCPL